MNDISKINVSGTEYNVKDIYARENKQDTLVSGTNIKTINNQSILGSGNILISSGSSDYADLTNKPKINGVTLEGNKTLSDLQADYNDLLNKPIKILDMEYNDIDVNDIEDDVTYKIINAGGIYNDNGAYLNLDEGSLLIKGNYGISYIGNSGVYWLPPEAISWEYSFCVSQEEVDLLVQGKEDAMEILNYLETSISLTLAHNHEARFINPMTSLKIIPGSGIQYIASFAFTSGSTATSFEYVSTIKWQGDDCSNLIFIPTSNKRYYGIIWFDGNIYHGSIRGVPVE